MSIAAFAWLIAGLVCVLLTIAVWRRSIRSSTQAFYVLIASAGVMLAMSGNPISLILMVVNLVLVITTWRLATLPLRRSLSTGWIVILILIFLLTKIAFPSLLIGPTVWIGISYLFLRLVHTSIDARHGRLGDVSLSEMVIYALHPATLIAGPIDRVQHSIAEQRRLPQDRVSYLNEGLWRLFTGIVKKVILANAFYSLTVAYDAIEATPPTSGAWIWVFAYSFYLYFDFAAYSDVAIGVGLLMGLRLPENFANPYLQPSITQFWQSWHITLSSWLRDYIFFPTSRYLLKRWGSRFSPLIILVSHLLTMIGSGLWHGLRLEMAVWGIWHAFGLYTHNRWTILQRRYKLRPIPTPIAILMTYLFVSLGWLFFNMRLSHALHILARLFGLR
jgi:alginate O-acetyltransferase complex protein AlgI